MDYCSSRPYYLHHCLVLLLFPPIFILIIRLCFHLSNLLLSNFRKCLGKIHKVLKPVEIKRESLIIGGNNSGSGIATGSTVSVVGSGATSATGGNAYNTSTTILAPNVSGTLNQCVSKMIYFYYIVPVLNVFFSDFQSNTICATAAATKFYFNANRKKWAKIDDEN